MGLLTRCPACTTVYKVVPDQLRISQGWVKCGQCGDIFDASQHLLQNLIESDTVLADALTKRAEEAPAVPEEPEEQTQLPEPETVDESPHADRGVCEVATPQEVSQPIPDGGSGDEPDMGASVVGAELEPLPVTDEDSVVATPLPHSDASALVNDGHDHEGVSFLRDEQRRSPWHGTFARVGLALLAVLLGAGLGGQWLYQERDRLSAAQPEWRPALQTFCKIWHCSIQPLRQTEAILVESATFHKAGSDRYRLSFVVKNSANLVLALPSIELTLTDLQDRVVVRRVLSPQDLSAMSDSLPPAAEWPVAVTIRVKTDTSMPAVVGYRLLAFYP